MNDVVDAKYDIKNKPDRPIASLKLTVGFSAAFTFGLLVSGIFFLVLSKSSLLWILALVVSIIVYNIIHKKTSSAIYVMGLCRTLLYLVAGYSFGDSFHVLAWAIVLGLYTAGITLVARGEDSETDASKYGYVLIYLPSFLSVYLILRGDSIDVSVLISSLLFLFWIIYCFRVFKKGGTGRIGKTVSFFTSVGFIAPNQPCLIHTEEVIVTIRTLDRQEIERYVAKDKPLDCAGSFKVESLGISLFTSVKSEDPTALEGLPLIRLYQWLRDQGFKIP